MNLAAASVSEVPHSPQNFCPGRFDAPQAEQATARRPQRPPHNFWLTGLSCRQWGQRMQANSYLFDHLVRPQQKRGRDRKPNGLRRSEVDDQLEPRRLFDGKISRLGTLEDLVGEVGRTPPQF